MPFLKRLGFFLVGLSVGLVFLAIFLRKKADQTGTEFCYLPNCRVLKELRSKPLAYSDDIQSMLQKGQLDSLGIARFLKEGNIDFGQSDPQATPCKIYLIEAPYNQTHHLMEVRNCRDSVLLVRLR